MPSCPSVHSWEPQMPGETAQGHLSMCHLVGFSRCAGCLALVTAAKPRFQGLMPPTLRQTPRDLLGLSSALLPPPVMVRACPYGDGPSAPTQMYVSLEATARDGEGQRRAGAHTAGSSRLLPGFLRGLGPSQMVWGGHRASVCRSLLPRPAESQRSPQRPHLATLTW